MEHNYHIGNRVLIISDDDFNGDTGVIEAIEDDGTIWVRVQPIRTIYHLPCEAKELVLLGESEVTQQ